MHDAHRLIPIPAKPFHHNLARCEVSHTTELCKHIALPGQISLCFLLNYFNLELPNKLLSMSQWDSCKSQTPSVTCSESRTFSFWLCRFSISLMSICLMTPCLRSCSGSCFLVRVSPNHNAEGPWAFGVCFQPWKIINVLMPIQAIVYTHFIRRKSPKSWWPWSLLCRCSADFCPPCRALRTCEVLRCDARNLRILAGQLHENSRKAMKSFNSTPFSCNHASSLTPCNHLSKSMVCSGILRLWRRPFLCMPPVKRAPLSAFGPWHFRVPIGFWNKLCSRRGCQSKEGAYENQHEKLWGACPPV